MMTKDNLAGKLPDIKPMYGAIFKDLLASYTHWGWIDIDVVVMGNVNYLLQQLQRFDVVTFPTAV